MVRPSCLKYFAEVASFRNGFNKIAEARVLTLNPNTPDIIRQTRGDLRFFIVVHKNKNIENDFEKYETSKDFTYWIVVTCSKTSITLNEKILAINQSNLKV